MPERSRLLRYRLNDLRKQSNPIVEGLDRQALVFAVHGGQMLRIDFERDKSVRSLRSARTSIHAAI